MKLSIGQQSEYMGADHWRWSSWIEGDGDQLDRIARVRWLLHPSFPQTVLVSEDRDARFRLDAGGWGTFLLRAELHFKGGETRTLRKNLELYYPDEEGSKDHLPSDKEPAVLPPVDSERPEVFLSYAASDKRAVMTLRRALEERGLKVLDDSTLSAGASIERALLELQHNADATVAYVSSELPSAFVANEINNSLRFGKPTLVVTSEDLGAIAGVPESVPRVQLGRSKPSEVASVIARMLDPEKAR